MAYRILCITPWFPNTPNEQCGNFIFRAVEALVRTGNLVTVLVTRPWTPRVFGLLHPDWIRPSLQVKQFDPALNLHVAHFPSMPRYYFSEFSGPLFKLGTERIVRQLSREFAPDIIHVHTEIPAYGAVIAGKELDLPVIVTLHGIETAPRCLNTERKKEILRGTLNGASRVVLVGEPLRAHFGPLTGRDDHFRVVPNGFYLPTPQVEHVRSSSGNILRIISVSNLVEGKGIDINIEALALLQKSGFTDWTYTVVGGGRDRAQLESMAADLGVGGRIRFTGPLSHDKALASLNDADVFLLPSYREAFGVAYLEAMAAGLFTVGVEGQGPEAFIRHGQTGYLVPPRDIGAIAKLLEFVMGNRDECRRVALCGCNLVRQEFTWDRHAERLMAVYAEIGKNKEHSTGTAESR